MTGDRDRRLSRRDLLLTAAFSGVGVAAAAAATARASEKKAGEGTVELLARPCLARNMHNGCLVQDKGREYFVLTNTNEITHVELIFIDTESGVGEAYPAPTGSGAWALQKLPGNQLGVGTYYNGTFLVFDVPSRKWVKSVKFPGEDYLWAFTIGGDGRLYTGTYPHAKLGALDVATGKVETWDTPSKPNLYLRHVSTLPDGRVYCNFGDEKPLSFAFDPKTKTFSAAPESMNTATTGVAWNGYFVAGQKAYRMPDLAVVTPLPFPAPENDPTWQVLPALSDDSTLVFRGKNTVYRVHKGETQVTAIAHIPTTAISVFAVNEAGKVFGTRGQDYYIAELDIKKLHLAAVPGPSSPREVFFLYADDQNRLWGGPPFGQTLFYIDLATGKVNNTRGVSNRGGEVYDVEVVDGVAFAVAYVGGEIIRFDPREPWNQIGGVNPHVIAKVEPQFIRPAAGITRGDDGKLYSGWMSKYGSYGGAIAITDPQTGATETIVNPLGVQGILGLAVHGGIAMIGTTLAGNGMPEQTNTQPKFGLYDLAARKVIFEQEFPGAKAVGHVAYDARTHRTACIAHHPSESGVHIFDNATQKFLPPSGDLRKFKPGFLASAGPGRVAFAEKNSAHLLNLATGAITPVATTPEDIHCLTFAPNGRLYIACGASVYRTVPLG